MFGLISHDQKVIINSFDIHLSALIAKVL